MVTSLIPIAANVALVRWFVASRIPTPAQDAACLGDAKALAAKHEGYDFLAIAGFLLPLGEHDAQDAICSEVADYLVQDADGKISAIKPWAMSPNKLFQILTAAHLVTVSQ